MWQKMKDSPWEMLLCAVVVACVFGFRSAYIEKLQADKIIGAMPTQEIVEVLGRVTNVADYGTDVVTSTRYLVRGNGNIKFINVPMVRSGDCPKFLDLKFSKDTGGIIFASPVILDDTEEN